MRAFAGAILVLCCTVPFAAAAVDFAVPVEAAGIAPSVKSIRVVCTAFFMDGTTGARGVQFVAVAAGAIKQTVNVTVDLPLAKAKPGTQYQCNADRAFEIDVTKLNPVPIKFLAQHNQMSEGVDIAQINLQANSVVKVGGKL